MARNVKLLLTENVDNLGIVGDVVNVRTGYARNYLLPRSLATQPSDEAIAGVQAKREEAKRQLAALRKEREAAISKMTGLEITLTRSCNDQGILYGAVTQQDIASALAAVGYAVKPREVRLPQVIKRVDAFDVHVKFDTDLDATIKLHVVADRVLEQEKREEIEIDDEGNLVERPRREGRGDRGDRGDRASKGDRAEKPAEGAEEASGAPKTETSEKPAKKPRADKPKDEGKGEPKSEKPKPEKSAGDSGGKKSAWAKAEPPPEFMPQRSKRRER